MNMNMSSIKVRKRNKGDYEVFQIDKKVRGWVEQFADGWRFFPKYQGKEVFGLKFKEVRDKAIAQVEEDFPYFPWG